MKNWFLFIVLFTFAFSLSSPSLWAGKKEALDYPWIVPVSKDNIRLADGQFSYAVGDLIARSNKSGVYGSEVKLYFAAILPDNSVMVERVCVSFSQAFASTVSFRLSLTETATIGYTPYDSKDTISPLMVTLLHANGRMATFKLTTLP
ncbi:MAG: hypothetical protein WC528_00740 [Patescibacteria group bacterium]